VRAAVYRGRGDIRIEDIAEPVPLGDELLIRVTAVGICGTDGHEYAHGPFQFAVPSRSPWGPAGALVPGHEFAGVVVGMGTNVTGFGEGDLVASASGVACGECRWCRRGRTNLCLRYETVGLQRHGGLAQLCVVPAASCAVVDPEILTPDAAALGQPMAIAVHAVSRGEPAAGMEVLVIGAGGIGAFLVFALAQSGARVSVIEADASRRELALRLGATRAVPPPPPALFTPYVPSAPPAPPVALWDATRAVRPAPPSPPALLDTLRDALGDGHSPELVYEVTGNPGGLALALGSLGRGTRLVLVGLQGAAAELDLRRLSLSEAELIGTNAVVAADDLPRALQLLGRRAGSWADVAPVALALDDLVDQGLRPLASGTSTRVKTLVDPWTPVTRRTQL
jgi:(R,R)-butanediol dehydrogenase / meso-butanediol dehydrogenase / diacetyl reductase